MTLAISWIAKIFDFRVIDLLVNLVGWIARGMGALLRHRETGLLQDYAYYFIVGVVVMVCLFLLGLGDTLGITARLLG